MNLLFLSFDRQEFICQLKMTIFGTKINFREIIHIDFTG
jgi:hypothetical protein